MTLELIAQAHAALKGHIRRTPMEESPVLSRELGVPVCLKLEFLQTTGSFKLRGAYFRLSRLSPAERSRGVVTCSAGNHGWAMAYAGRLLDVPVRIYVPASVDESKKAGMEAQGAEVIVTRFPGYDEAESLARQEAECASLPFVSPFDDTLVMAANGGSLALEILEDQPSVRSFLVPVGGGGLAAGLGFYVKSVLDAAVLIASQHLRCPALQLSLDSGRAITRLPAVQTAAGGIEGGIGKNTFRYLRHLVDRVILCDEDEILAAVGWFMQEHRYLIEPSSAVVLAACRSGRLRDLRSPLAIVLTGRNVAIGTVRRILNKSSADSR